MYALHFCVMTLKAREATMFDLFQGYKPKWLYHLLPYLIQRQG